MYIGIDFGTSNSSVAEFTPKGKSSVRVHSTRDGKATVLPTVIYVSENKNIFGQRVLHSPPGNLMKDFKKDIASPNTRKLDCGVELTAADGCTEIIGELLRMVRRGRQDEEIQGAVLTHPARCTPHWRIELEHCAKKAGIRRMKTLQEPVAACIAADAELSFGSGELVLVYDIGAGTFDYSLMTKNKKGDFEPIAVGGNDTIGGKVFDGYIFGKIFLPSIEKNYEIRDSFFQSENFGKFEYEATKRAEEVKIDLSSENEVLAELSAVELPDIRDDNGELISIGVEITRTQYNRLIESDLAETVDTLKSCLAKAKFNSSDIDHLVLVGGPTYTPLLRKLLQQEFGDAVNLNSDLDPMTIVASGAALYSGSVNWRGRGHQAPTQVRQEQDNVQVGFPSRTAGNNAIIKVRSQNPAEGKQVIEIRSSGGWSSGLRKFENTIDVLVPLELGDNEFAISIFSHDNKLVWESREKTRILRVPGMPKKLVETNTIAIKVCRDDGRVHKDVLLPLVTKGTTLPATGECSLTLAKLLTKDDNTICVELFTQEEETNVVPHEPNIHVATLKIPVEKSPFLPFLSNEDVLIRWKRGGLDEIALDVTIRESNVKRKHEFIDRAEDFTGEPGIRKARSAAAACRDELHTTRLLTSDTGPILDIEHEIESIDEAISDATGSQGEVERIIDRIRGARNRIALIYNSTECQAKVIEQELNEEIRRFNRHYRAQADETMPEKSREFDRLGRECKKLLDSGDPDNFFSAKEKIYYMDQIRIKAYWAQPGTVIRRFKELKELRDLARDKKRFDSDVEEGQNHLRSNEIDRLRQVIFRIFQNRPRSLADLKYDG